MPILIVDDSLFARRRLRALLERAGYTVCEADGGAAALHMLNEIVPELITVDLLMPDMDGLELIRRIRAIYPALPILVHSADIQQATAAAALAAGASAFVGKTSSTEEFLTTAHQLIASAGLKMSDAQRDAFTEMMNIAMGQAAAALGNLLNCHVALSVPHVQCMDTAMLRAFLDRAASRLGALVTQRHSGLLNGVAALILPALHAASLVRLLLHTERELAQLSPAEQTVLAEVGNIILNSALARLGDTMGSRLQIGLPSVTLDLASTAAAELLFSSAPNVRHAIVLLSRLMIGETELTVYIVLLLPHADVERLLTRLNA
ncbi:MAG: response regulator [Anaerolineae bacterium]|nr:response regulator [Anaerolineae bacterium]